jgi:hypothetical protein
MDVLQPSPVDRGSLCAPLAPVSTMWPIVGAECGAVHTSPNYSRCGSSRRVVWAHPSAVVSREPLAAPSLCRHGPTALYARTNDVGRCRRPLLQLSPIPINPISCRRAIPSGRTGCAPSIGCSHTSAFGLSFESKRRPRLGPPKQQRTARGWFADRRGGHVGCHEPNPPRRSRRFLRFLSGAAGEHGDVRIRRKETCGRRTSGRGLTPERSFVGFIRLAYRP